MRRLILIATVPALLLAGCAGGAPPPSSATGLPVVGESAYGLFLAGGAAMNAGRNSEAARFLELARAGGGDDPAIVERAFTSALLAGDVKTAAAIAPEGAEVSEPTRRLGRLVRAVSALADGKGAAAREALGSEPLGFPHRSVSALLGPWFAAAAGDAEGAVVRPQVRGDAAVDYFGKIGQAHLFERARRYDEAETDFKAVTGGGSPSELAVLAYGAFLERRGRRPEALALYDAGIGRNPASLGLVQARARAATGRGAPSAPSLKEGAAFALLAPAATMLSAKQDQVALAYLRLALTLDPQRNDAWLMLGDVLQQRGDAEGARAAYAKPKPNSPEFPSAQAKLAWSHQSAGDKATAIRLARAGAETGDIEARATLADLLRANSEFDEAITILTGLIDEAKAPDWRLFYARGQANERSGRWPAAEADLSMALALRPDESELLNYLGYAWIDRGERLDEAKGMIEKALAANPRSGAIVDSLGWAYFRKGDYAKAVELLEQAVELEAGDPEINNHLGDAYWMVGRKDEAGFQWRRVLTLDPDAKMRADAEAKIAGGLGPKPRVAGP